MRRHHINYLKASRNAFIGFVAAFAAYWAVQLLWWEFYPYATAEVNVPIEVLNEDNKVTPGGQLNMLVIFDKQTLINPEVSRNIICQTGNVYDVIAPAGARGRPTGKFIAEVEFTVTTLIHPTEICVFEFRNTYQVNPIRTITKVWQSEPFEIVE